MESHMKIHTNTHIQHYLRQHMCLGLLHLLALMLPSICCPQRETEEMVGKQASCVG